MPAPIATAKDALDVMEFEPLARKALPPAQEPPGYSGKQAIDEEVLSELAGITNFDHYWCEGKAPEKPIYIDKSL